MLQENYKPDICINKHKLNEQSRQANRQVKKQRDKNTILKFINDNGTGYSKQLAKFMGKGLNCISGRFSELKEENIIEPALDKDGNEFTIDGCKVYRLKNNEMLLII